MKEKDREIRDYINDIIESCEDIMSFTNDMSFDDFIADKKTTKAVIRSLEVLGEAAKKLPIEFNTKPLATAPVAKGFYLLGFRRKDKMMPVITRKIDII